MFLPFTRSLDVIGHELAHGVTQFTSGLNYQDQSGALNESVSDVFGVLVKQRLLGQSADEADWLIGAELLGRASRASRCARWPPRAPPTTTRAWATTRSRRTCATTSTPPTTTAASTSTPASPTRPSTCSRRPSAGTAWEVAGQVWFDTITGDIRADCDFATFAAPHRRGRHSPSRGGVRGRRRRARRLGGGRGVVCRRRTGSPHSLPATGAPRPTRDEPAPRGEPAPGDEPAPATAVSVRRTGGVAGRTLERTVALEELPRADARAWRSLLADDRLPAIAGEAAGRRGIPDAFCYGVRCEAPPLDVELPEMRAQRRGARPPRAHPPSDADRRERD